MDANTFGRLPLLDVLYLQLAFISGVFFMLILAIPPYIMLIYLTNVNKYDRLYIDDT